MSFKVTLAKCIALSKCGRKVALALGSRVWKKEVAEIQVTSPQCGQCWAAGSEEVSGMEEGRVHQISREEKRCIGDANRCSKLAAGVKVEREGGKKGRSGFCFSSKPGRICEPRPPPTALQFSNEGHKETEQKGEVPRNREVTFKHQLMGAPTSQSPVWSQHSAACSRAHLGCSLPAWTKMLSTVATALPIHIGNCLSSQWRFVLQQHHMNFQLLCFPASLQFPWKT